MDDTISSKSFLCNMPYVTSEIHLAQITVTMLAYQFFTTTRL